MKIGYYLVFLVASMKASPIHLRHYSLMEIKPRETLMTTTFAPSTISKTTTITTTTTSTSTEKPKSDKYSAYCKIILKYKSTLKAVHIEPCITWLEKYSNRLIRIQKRKIHTMKKILQKSVNKDFILRNF